MHADYLQGWERVGYMAGNFFRAAAEAGLHSVLGTKLPLVDLEQQPTMNPNVDYRARWESQGGESALGC